MHSPFLHPANIVFGRLQPMPFGQLWPKLCRPFAEEALKTKIAEGGMKPK
jgi:hypothetical protein